jgi:hypothetical protein
MNTRILLALALPLGATTGFADTILYRETFGNTGGNQLYSFSGWALHSVSSTNVVNVRTADTNQGIGPAVGKPTAAEFTNVGAGTTVSTNNGLAYLQLQSNFGAQFGAGAAALAWTNEHVANGATFTTGQIGSISFYLGNGSTGTPVKIAIQVGGAWYVSAADFTSDLAVSSAADFNARATEKTFTFTRDAAAWRTLNFTPGSNPLQDNGAGNLAVGGSSLVANLIDGNVTAFGFFVPSGATATVRVDTFTITAIPEPSTFAALAGFGALGCAALRRRARR